jgi:hypothetical protein
MGSEQPALPGRVGARAPPASSFSRAPNSHLPPEHRPPPPPACRLTAQCARLGTAAQTASPARARTACRSAAPQTPAPPAPANSIFDSLPPTTTHNACASQGAWMPSPRICASLAFVCHAPGPGGLGPGHIGHRPRGPGAWTHWRQAQGAWGLDTCTRPWGLDTLDTGPGGLGPGHIGHTCHCAAAVARLHLNRRLGCSYSGDCGTWYLCESYENDLYRELPLLLSARTNDTACCVPAAPMPMRLKLLPRR